jgi:cytochrome c551/c552
MGAVRGRSGILAVLAAVSLLGAAGCGSSGQKANGGGRQQGAKGSPTPAPASKAAGSGGDVASKGAQLFSSNGCSGCHTLKRATATGTTGPDLDTQLNADAKRAGKPLKAFVRQSIVAPSAYVAKGYQDGIMPKTFGNSLSASQVNALVTFITGGSQ